MLDADVVDAGACLSSRLRALRSVRKADAMMRWLVTPTTRKATMVMSKTATSQNLWTEDTRMADDALLFTICKFTLPATELLEAKASAARRAKSDAWLKKAAEAALAQKPTTLPTTTAMSSSLEARSQS